MYKVLIVEDIDYIRRGIVAIIKQKYNFEVLEAKDGNEGFYQFEQHDVDFILTDIRMPICDGIKFVERIRESNQEIPIIIISGYNDFSYAQKAIDMGVNGYILKPIKDSDFYKNIDKIIKNIDKKTINKFSKNYEKDNILKCLFYENTIENTMNLCKNKKIIISLIEVVNQQHKNSKEKFRNDVIFLIENLRVEEIIYVMKNPVHKFQIIVIWDLKNKNYGFIYELCQNIINKIKLDLDYEVMMSVSTTHIGINKCAYDEAREAMLMKLINLEVNIFSPYNYVCESSYKNQLIQIGNIEKYIRRADIENIKIVLKNSFNFNGLQLNLKNYIQLVLAEVSEIIIKIYGYSDYKKIKFDQLLDEIYIINTKNEVIKKIIDEIENLYKIKNINVLEDNDIVKKVKRYIDKNYFNEITVKSLAIKFSVNYSYLSASFTKEFGVSIVSYITEIRINQAKKLLAQSEADIGTVADLVGYNDLQYFYRVFKKHTGKTPLSFRNVAKKVQ